MSRIAFYFICSVALSFIVAACDSSGAVCKGGDADVDIDGDSDWAYESDSEAEEAVVPAPKISVQSDISFGAASLGQRREYNMSIGNEGDAILNIFDMRIVDSSDEFGLSEAFTELSLFPGDSVEVQLYYEPIDAESDTGTLLIYNNDPTKRVARVNLSSLYKGEANISVDVQSIDFGTVAVGSSSAVRRVRIGNVPGSTDDNRILTVSDINIANQAGGSFQLSPDNPKTPFYIGPSMYQDIYLSFAPQSWGDLSDILSIASDSNLESDRLLNVSLSGYGGAARLCVVPDPIAFGSVKAATTAVRQITLEACGEDDVTPVAISIVDSTTSSFSISNPPQTGRTLKPGESLIFDVEFSPEAQLGLESATLEVESDDMFFPVQSIGISGYGAISDLYLVQTSLLFGDVRLGESSEKTLTLRNVGLWDLTINDFEFSPQDAAFEIVEPENVLPLSIPGGETATVTVRFNPNAESLHTANMDIVSDNSAGTLTVGLSGRGVEAHMTLSEDGNVEFGEARLGETLTRRLIVGNSGRYPLTVSSLEIVEGSDFFSVDPAVLTRPIAYQQEEEIILNYSPGGEVGQNNGVLRIVSDSDDGVRSEREINLHGSSIDPGLNIEPAGLSYDFGPVNVGACAGPLEFVVTNDGFGTLLIQNIIGLVGFGEVFSLVNDKDFPQAIRPFASSGDSLRFWISFCPAEESVNYDATLQILSNDYSSIDYRFYFHGSGGGCPLNHINCDNDPSVCETYCEGAASNQELCNGIDDNCDCRVDEGYDIGSFCSGVGVCSDGVSECNILNPQQVVCSTSVSGSEYDGSPEKCDYVDNDCDGKVDENYTSSPLNGAPLPCDGVGACGAGYYECKGPEAVRCSTDIGGSVDESREEICNGLDDDCDGSTDENWSIGETCQGTGQCGQGVWECSSADSRVCSSDIGGSQYPAYEEICDHLDNDCDGETDETFNIGRLCAGTGECGIGEFECASETESICSVDPNGSQYDLNDPLLAGDPETCDGRDNDCDGLTDEGFIVDPVSGTPLTCDGKGECGTGFYECNGASSVRCSTDVGGSQDESVQEICNGKDDNCNGIADEHLAIGTPCSGIGECGSGIWEEAGLWECQGLYSRVCSSDFGGSQYDINDPAKPGSYEICDGLDNDCDNLTDEDFSVGAPCVGIGECGLGQVECSGSDNNRCSTDIGGSEYDGRSEVCDHLDNDCNGETDEIFPLRESCVGQGECSDQNGVYLCGEDGQVKCSADYSGTEESCNRLDDDCDCRTDEICRQIVYRFVGGTESERDHVFSLFSVPPLAGYVLEGPVFMVYSEQLPSNTVQLDAFSRLSAADHIYTIDSAEKAALLIDPDWAPMAPLGYAAASAENGTIPLFRLAKSSSSDHIYTTDTAERDSLISSGYVLEGTAAWVWPLW